MTRRKTQIASPREITVSFNPIKGFNDTISPDAGGYAYAQSMQNFVVSDGTLVPGEGVEMLKGYVIPEGFIFRRLYLFKGKKEDGSADNRLIFCAGDGYLYECALGGGTFTKITAATFSSPPVGLMYNYNGKNVMIFSKPGGGIYIYDGTNMTLVPEAPEITSMCLHYERLFVTTGGDDNSLWFSDDFDPANWNVSLSEAGFIDMNDFRGDLIKVVSFGDYLYVFRSFGITRISAYTDQRQFSATNLFLCSGRIFADSIIVCGDCMLFTATDGMYRFDGLSTQRISDAFVKRLDLEYQYYKGVYFNGYAYIRIHAMFDDQYRLELLRLNPKTLDAAIIRGAWLSDMAVVDVDGYYNLYGLDQAMHGLCVLTPDKHKVLLGAMQMVWENGDSDFGIPTVKTLKKLTFYSKAAAKAIVTADGVSYTYSVKGNKGPIVLKPNIKGFKFRLRFEATAEDTLISSPKLTLEYYE